MSFSWDVKEKLCSIPMQCPSCARSELAGIVGFSGDFSEKRLKLLTGHKLFAERVVADIEECIGIRTEISGDKSKRILIENEELLEKLRTCLCLADGQSEEEFRSEILNNECCRAAYVRGAFLSGGCVTDPEKEYHLEFDTKYKKSAGRLEKLLCEMGCPVRITSRKEHHLVYLKGADDIADILGLIGAGVGALALYSIQIEKEMRNRINRQVNCENANADKIAAAAAKQLTAIRKIQSKAGLKSLPDNLREIAAMRLKYPEAGLEQLGQKLVPPIGKSGVNHRLKKIIEIASEL